MHLLSRLVAIAGVSTLMLLAGCGSSSTSNSRVVLGQGDILLADNPLLYLSPVVVQVSNSDGAPQQGVLVQISLRASSYTKGMFVFNNDVDSDGEFDQWRVNASAVCLPEDSNGNGILEPGEDVNGNGVLEPSVPTIAQHPTETPTVAAGTATLVTNANGLGYFVISYPRSEANWVTVEVTATVEDGLPENRASTNITLPILVDDIGDPLNDPPGGVVGPYGSSNNCSDPS